MMFLNSNFLFFFKFIKLFLIFLSSLSILSCTSYSTSNHRKISSESFHSTFRNPEPLKYQNEYIFDWPVDRAKLSRGFMPKKRRPHMGIDLAAPRKTPVFSSHQGMVIYAGRDFRGFGNMILIESGYGWATLYAHLDKILVTEGQKVGRGESIALMGSTGRSTGPHLHFEIRKNKGPVDPLLYLPGGMEASRKLAQF